MKLCNSFPVVIAFCFLAVLCLVQPATAAETCKDIEIECWGNPHPDTGQLTFCGKVRVDSCWSWGLFGCVPCSVKRDDISTCSYRSACAAAYPNCCSATSNGKCSVYWKKVDAHAICPSGFEPPYRP